MRKKLLVFVATSLVFASVMRAQSDHELVIDGDIPSSYDFNSDNVVRIWQIVQQVTGVHKDRPPHITFILFLGDIPEWKTAWVQEHPQFAAEALNRIDSAYHFEDTNRIQVSPSVFKNFRGLGVGYYIIVHEMMHYLFDGVIPGKDHHCFFRNSGFNQRLREALVAEDISHPFLLLERESLGANVSDGCYDEKISGEIITVTGQKRVVFENTGCAKADSCTLKQVWYEVMEYIADYRTEVSFGTALRAGYITDNVDSLEGYIFVQFIQGVSIRVT